MKGAGVGKRAVAIIIDWLIMLPFIAIIVNAFGTSSTTSSPNGTSYNFNVGSGGTLLLLLLLLGYPTVLEALLGATVGKFALGLRVVRPDGSPIGWGQSLGRNLLRIVDGLFVYLVGAIVVWATESNQRIGDLAAHTFVVTKGTVPARPDMPAMPAAPGTPGTWGG
jgi:uncharacterized RDD family membrane protein YckC